MTLACKAAVMPRSLWIAAALTQVRVPVGEITITAGRNGNHIVGSKHYSDDALDVRTKNFPTREAKLAFAASIRTALGPAYQVVFEAAGTVNEHLHIEYDPRP